MPDFGVLPGNVIFRDGRDGIIFRFVKTEDFGKEGGSDRSGGEDFVNVFAAGRSVGGVGDGAEGADAEKWDGGRVV